MKISNVAFWLSVFFIGAGTVFSARADSLKQRFADPPAEARLRVYWWWLNGNVTKRAITRDLEQMKAKGIAGALIFDADGAERHGNTPTAAGPMFATPAWRGLFRHALSEADRLGIEISLNLQSGWNLGGPPVPPRRAAQTLVFSETKVKGPGVIEQSLPAPRTKKAYAPAYRDIAVVAYPAPKHGHAPISRLADKLAEREVGASCPDCNMLLDDVPAIEGEQACMSADVLELTDKMSKNGTLRWDVPAGEWIVLRFGCAPTGRKNSTGSAGWTGLVINYLNADDLRWYWKNVVDPLIADAGPLAGTTWKYVHTDSWECRGMNWTDDMRGMFRRRRGYDLLPYMPVLAGRIVNDRRTANRFLADFRKTVGDCVVENHYKVLRELAAEHGMNMHPEAGGPHAGPIDSLRCLSVGDIPMAEFWAESWMGRVDEEDRFFVKQPASVAHTYGRRLVAAEGFTAIGPNWQESLWSNLRPSFDRAACEGLNMTFWHTFTCSPEEMGAPGQEYHAGAHFNPQITWWPMADAFTSYINRCQFMLQQGLFVADAVYYYGDHVPNFAQLKKSDPARVLPGYDYDVATEEIVLDRMAVRNGRIVLPDGMSYAVLVMPPVKYVSLPVLRKIERMVEAGATVVGPKPKLASGLGNQPQNDVEVRRIADRLWDTGRIVADRTAREVLQVAGLPPDFDYKLLPSPASGRGAGGEGGMKNLPSPASGRGAGGEGGMKLDYIHRCDDATDIYFVRNCGDKPVVADAAFRVVGKQPELWNPVDGSIRALPQYRRESKLTIVPLRLEPYGSYFVVFRNPAGSGTQRNNFPEYKNMATISGPWRVSFDPRWGGPENVRFDKLVDWTTRPEEGIKHYSGTAVYRKSFELEPEVVAGGNLYLDLGTVKELARVRVNGRDLGVVWCPPWRVEISDAIRSGKNELEIEVVNFWPNRIIGDAKLPPEQRRTKTNIAVLKADAPLMPSGLLGPLTLGCRTE
ncbi:MAG: glycoside hydrolase [Pirellulales bacterium]|nr:glycoside hydrolase [Pirellulales bacterium]